METDDILKEMSEFADTDSQTIGRDVLRREIHHFADRIKVAVAESATTTPTCKESLQVGNTAKMREALEWFWIRRSMLDFCHNNLSTKTWEDWDKVYCFLREFADKVQSALSAPPRNCDAFSKAEVLEVLEDRPFFFQGGHDRMALCRSERRSEMKLHKKIYLHVKGFIYGVLTAPINAIAWIYCNAIKWPREDILREELKEK